MEVKMLYCKSCNKAFRGGLEYCPNCSMALYQTNYLVDDWKQLTASEKMGLKTRWKEENLETVAPAAAYLIDMPVTTCDIKEDYEIIGLVQYQISNSGYNDKLSKTVEKYRSIYEFLIGKDLYLKEKSLFILLSEFYQENNERNQAFYVATEELKRKAKRLGADAIIGIKQDVNIDQQYSNIFCLQLYGTAVKFKREEQEE